MTPIGHQAEQDAFPALDLLALNSGQSKASAGKTGHHGSLA